MRWGIFISLLLLGGCYSGKNSTVWLQDTVNQRVEKRVDVEEDLRWDGVIESWLEESLSVEDAAQIALVKNPSIRARYEQMGIARGDLIEAGLFQNPQFDGSVRYPNKDHFVTNSSLTVTLNVLDFFLVPLKKSAASSRFEYVKWMVAHDVVHFLAEVERAYYELQWENERLRLYDILLDIAEAVYVVAKEQFYVGNISRAFFKMKETEYQRTLVAWEQIRMMRLHAKRELHILMGLDPKEIYWKIERLKEPQEKRSKILNLDELVVHQRFDIVSLEKEIESLEKTLPTMNWFAYTNGQFGVSSEKEPEGVRVTGPAFAGSVPIFNFGQGDRTRVHAQIEERKRRLRGLELSAVQKTEHAEEHMIGYQAIVNQLLERTVPIAERVVSETHAKYNVMAASIYELLEVKKEEIMTRMELVESIRNYWISYADLKEGIGGKLPE